MRHDSRSAAPLAIVTAAATARDYYDRGPERARQFNMNWNKEQHDRAFTRLDEVDRQARRYVKDLLDEYRGEERPQRYYDILAGFWLQGLSHAVLVAMEFPLDVERLQSPRITLQAFHTDADLASRVVFDENFHSLLRFLLECRADDKVGFETPITVFTHASGTAGGFVRRLATRLLAKVGNRDGILVCSPYAKCSIFEWVAFVLRARKVMCWDELDSVPAFDVAIDDAWRLARFRSIDPSGGGLLEAIKRLVPLFIPVAYLEGFPKLRCAALRMRVGSPKGFYTANALYQNPLFKLLAAEHHESTLLLGHQHGGCYGMDLRHAPEEYERSICDFFYTWGWIGNSEETRALSPPAFRKSARRKRWKVMLCLGDFPKTRYRIQYFPVADEAARTIEDTLEFARSVALAPDGSVLIRPPPTEYGRGWLDELKHSLPGARVDDFSKKAINRFAESELVFHNYISTGWLESIWLDVPTLALWDPEVCAFRTEAEQHMVRFEHYGLLHRSGTSAARFHASVQDDIDSWWNQPQFRRARAEFAARFVRVRVDWQREWIQEFEWLSQNRQAIISRRGPPAARGRSSGSGITDVRAR